MKYFKSLLSTFFYSSIIFILLFYIIYEKLIDDQICLVFIHLYTISSLCLYKKLQFSKIDSFNNFGSSFLSVTLFFRIFFLIDGIFFGARIEEWPETVIYDNFQLLVLKAESISLLGILIIISSWGIFTNHKKISNNSHKTDSNSRIYIYVYILSLIIQLLTKFLNLDLGPFMQFTFVVNSLGIGSIFYFCRNKSLNFPKLWLFYSFILALPFGLLALKSGMKEAMFFPFIPFIILSWQYFNSNFYRIIIIVFSFAVLSLSQLYITYIRYESWLNERSLSLSEIFVNSIGNSDSEIIFSSFNTICSRFNSTIPHAVTVAMADNSGFLPNEILGVIPASFVPRIFWPEKPILRPGSDHTKRIKGSISDDEKIESAAAPGFFTELYLAGGILVVIIFSIIYGIAISKIQLYTSFSDYSFVNLLNFYLVYNIFRFDEIAIAYAFTGLLILFLSLSILIYLSKLFTFSR